MKAIWKFPLLILDLQDIPMPRGASMLCVQAVEYSGEPCIWAVVDTDAAIAQRRVHMLGTGHDASRVDPVPYLGSFQLQGGSLVFHVFVENEA